MAEHPLLNRRESERMAYFVDFHFDTLPARFHIKRLFSLAAVPLHHAAILLLRSLFFAVIATIPGLGLNMLIIQSQHAHVKIHREKT